MSDAKRSKPGRKKPLLVFFPVEVIDAMNAMVKAEDTDRSKFIRKAVRNALRRLPS